MKIKIAITEVLLITLATAFLYTASYVYESGFCEVYDIPEDFIKIDYSKLFGLWLPLMLFLSAFLYFAIFHSTLSFQSKIIKWLIYPNICFLGITYLINRSGIVSINGFKMWAFLWLLTNIYLWIFLLFKRRKINQNKKRSVTKHHRKEEEENNSDKRKNIISPSKNDKISDIKLLMYVIAGTSITIFIFIMVCANGFARTQEYFFYPKSDTNLLVIRIYDQNLICRRLNTDKSLQPGIIVLNLAANKETELLKRKVGLVTNFQRLEINWFFDIKKMNYPILKKINSVNHLDSNSVNKMRNASKIK